MKKKLIITTFFLSLGLASVLQGGITKIDTTNHFKGELIQQDFPKVKTTRDFLKEIEDYEEKLRLEEEKRRQEEERLKEKQHRERERCLREQEKLRLSRGITSNKGREVKLQISAYCPCRSCSEGWNTKTASGTRAKWGIIAAPSNIPFGTKMKIQGFGDKVFTVEDRGGAIYNMSDGTMRVDIFVDSHSKALKIGRQNVKGWILK